MNLSHHAARASIEAYRQAGVDLDRADEAVSIAKRLAQTTLGAGGGVLGGIGGFSGAFEIPSGYQQPVLLAACDGVGTKLKLANALQRHDTIGIDLVAMSVNDLLVSGGRPLVFLDYFATSALQTDVFDAVLSGIAEGCRQSGCALLGGETAEMPGFYANGEYDLAGFCVGVVEKARQLPAMQRLGPGHVAIGLASSGFHSNGYSLIRRLALNTHAPQNLLATPQGFSHPLGDTLLAPTRIYVQPVLRLLEALPDVVDALVHITGGGFYDNLPRVLPASLAVRLDATAWTPPPVFGWLQQLGALSDETMYHTFNQGIGMVLLCAARHAQDVIHFLAQQDATLAPRILGEVIPRDAAEMPGVVMTGLVDAS